MSRSFLTKLLGVGLFGVVVLMGAAALLFHGSPDAWIGYSATLSGGILSGTFTIIGVIFAFSLERGHGENEKLRVQQNQLRLIAHELKENRSVLRTAQVADKSALQHLGYEVWQNVRFQLVWLFEEEFSDLAEVYSVIRVIHTKHLVGLSPHENTLEDLQKKIDKSLNYLKTVGVTVSENIK